MHHSPYEGAALAGRCSAAKSVLGRPQQADLRPEQLGPQACARQWGPLECRAAGRRVRDGIVRGRRWLVAAPIEPHALELRQRADLSLHHLECTKLSQRVAAAGKHGSHRTTARQALDQWGSVPVTYGVGKLISAAITG